MTSRGQKHQKTYYRNPDDKSTFGGLSSGLSAPIFQFESTLYPLAFCPSDP